MVTAPSHVTRLINWYIRASASHEPTQRWCSKSWPQIQIMPNRVYKKWRSRDHRDQRSKRSWRWKIVKFPKSMISLISMISMISANSNLVIRIIPSPIPHFKLRLSIFLPAAKPSALSFFFSYFSFSHPQISDFGFSNTSWTLLSKTLQSSCCLVRLSQLALA